MRNVGLFEAKNRLSELVERAAHGEKIGITRRGKLAAVIGPAQPKVNLKEIFDSLDRIRKRAKPLPKGVTVKDLIEEGRI
jgi:prevent-host-death family protein